MLIGLPETQCRKYINFIRKRATNTSDYNINFLSQVHFEAAWYIFNSIVVYKAFMST